MTSKTFAVRFEGAADTRWHEQGHQLIEALQHNLDGFAEVMTRGAIPCVTVEEIFTDKPVTAAGRADGERKVADCISVDQHGAGACASSLPTPTPACQRVYPAVGATLITTEGGL